MKRLLLAALATVMVTTSALAEIQTYTDQCLSFQYDDAMPGRIAKTTVKDSAVYYTLDTDGHSASVSINTIDRLASQFDESEDEYFKIEKISDDKIKSTNFISGEITISQLINTTESHFSFMSYTEPNDNDYCQAFLDSIIIDDSFKDGFVFDAIEDDVEIEYIFRNKCYSEQAINYAQAALDVCNQYLGFDIDGKEAGKKIAEIIKRAESYCNSSDNKYDRDVYSAIFLGELNFSMNDDGDIMEMKKELQAIVDAGFEGE